MSPSSSKSILAACLLTLGTAWAGPSSPSPADGNVSQDDGPSAPAQDAAGVSAELIHASPAVWGEHAPLAWFSLASIAVGGVFYGINGSMHRTNVEYTAGDRTQLTSAIGVAGLTALLAAGSYFYYAHVTAEKARNWDAKVTGGVSPAGGMSVGALVSLPLPSISR
ncbi:MAG: hypothetical protein JWO30_1127 [Fibrobacteres bacterium]|nr:hypothetical protein [Fibrobacterota bacterium]